MTGTKIAGVTFKNPFILPSGITEGYEKALDGGVAGITWKSLTVNVREGNPLPRVWKYDHGFINSVGLRNPGIDRGLSDIKTFMEKRPDAVMIASLFATKLEEFRVLVEKTVKISPHMIELNLSCPNVDDDFGKPLGMETGAAGKVVKTVRNAAGKIPLIAKLSPNVSNIADIAGVCEAEGADLISAINTVGPGMIIDIQKRQPVLGALKGGISGPGIFPIAVRCIYEIYQAVKIPIIGMGGVSKWQDVIEIVMAGASLVGMGSATYSKTFKVYDNLNTEVENYLRKNKIDNLSDIVGVAHK